MDILWSTADWYRITMLSKDLVLIVSAAFYTVFVIILCHLDMIAKLELCKQSLSNFMIQLEHYCQD